MNGWKQWSEQVSTSSFLEKKAAESLAREGLEGFQALGKDEVTSSNLVSSSKPLKLNEFQGFFHDMNWRILYARLLRLHHQVGRSGR